MLEKDVPQEGGIAGGLKEVCYAVDDKGQYVLAPSSGWEPKNVVNGQAWDLLNKQLDEARRKVIAGKASLLAYHMVKNQMDVRLLAQYTGFFTWQVRLHLKPAVFARLRVRTLSRYAELFRISIVELTSMDLIWEG